MAGRGKGAGPKKKENAYKMPDPIPNGEVIHDNLMKKKWRIGPSIGVGGFGEIYSACDHESSPKKGSNYPYVVKIEPHENGPLFVEKHFYIRNANKDDITKFMSTRKLTSLGMPTYHGNGTHESKGVKYRYLVLERYGKDVGTLFKDCGRSFPPATVFQLGIQMIDVLEYIHSRGYVHADLKGGNILLGLKKGTENQAYLVDFGLAARVQQEKEFKPDPKCAHNGTIEYTSRDAHLGVATMRGDLEILAYNMLQWLVGELPWEKTLKQPKTVQTMKEAFMKDVRKTITKQYPQVPDALIKFFEYINTLQPKQTPDYTKCLKLFEDYLNKESRTKNSKLEFTPSKKGKSKVPVTTKDDSDSEKIVVKKARKAPKQNTDSPKVRKGRKAAVKELNEDSGDENEEPEERIRKTTKVTKQNGDVARSRKARKAAEKIVIEDSDDESETKESSEERRAGSKRNGDVPKPRRGKNNKPTETSKDSGSEYEPDSSIVQSKFVKRGKRKSSEPKLLVNVKKVKLTPKATPPAKTNHVNIATQTSTDTTTSNPRQVSFDSPICEIINDRISKASKDSLNSSGDIFEDTFVIVENKVKPKRRLISEEKVTVKKVIKKKVTTVKPKGRSYKDFPSIVNGRSPPK